MLDRAAPRASTNGTSVPPRDGALVPAELLLVPIPPAEGGALLDDGNWCQQTDGAGGGDVCWTYPSGSPLHARHARLWLAAYLEAIWNDDDAVFIAVTAAAEVLANASQHGAGLVTVVIRANPDGAFLEVGDDSPELPVANRTGDDDESGRGLQIVEALSACWRVTPRKFGGKTVQVVLANAVT